MCHNTMHNCTMSSSVIEATSNGVPSLHVTINMHIHALRVRLSVGTGSLPEAAAVDEVDIFTISFFFQVMVKGCNDVLVHERIQEVVTIL